MDLWFVFKWICDHGFRFPSTINWQGMGAESVRWWHDRRWREAVSWLSGFDAIIFQPLLSCWGEGGTMMRGYLGWGVRGGCSSKWPALTHSTPPPESLLLDLLPPFLADFQELSSKSHFRNFWHLGPSLLPRLSLSFLTHSFTFQTIVVPDTQTGASGGIMAGLTKVGATRATDTWVTRAWRCRCTSGICWTSLCTDGPCLWGVWLKSELPRRQLLQQILPVDRSYPANIKFTSSEETISSKGTHLSQRKMIVMKAMTRSMRKLMVTPTKAAVSRQRASGEVKLTTTWWERFVGKELTSFYLAIRTNGVMMFETKRFW